MAVTDQQSKSIEARRTLHRAGGAVEGDAAKYLLDVDIASINRILQTATTMEEVFRAQGAIKALERFRAYLTEAPIFDRNQ